MTQGSASAKPSGTYQPPQRLMKYVNSYADEQYIPDITVNWMYRPHTITALAVTVGFLLYQAWNTNAEIHTTVQNTKNGIFAAAFFIIMLGLLVFPSGPFIRPHPIIWRLVFGVAVCYEIFLIVLLFQKKSDAREMMKYFDDKLPGKLVEYSYSDDCSLTWTAMKPKVIDIFVIGHFVGWVLKSLIIRDVAICWFISITWELIEIVFVHMLPNFSECWWDQWILDVLICNGLGIYFGNKLCEYLEVKKYDWKGVHQQPTYTDKVRRLVAQFAPESWMRVRWEKTASLKRFFGVHVLVAAIHLEELNAFFLKYLLWIPSDSYLNHVRLGFWFFFSLPCMRQFYVYMTDPTVKSIGRQSFLCIVIIATELLIIFKLSVGEFKTPIDPAGYYTALALIISYILFSAWGVWYILKNHPNDDIHQDLSSKLQVVDSAATTIMNRSQDEVKIQAARQLVANQSSVVRPSSNNKQDESDSEDEESEEEEKKPARRSRARSSSRSRPASTPKKASTKGKRATNKSPARSPSKATKKTSRK